MNQCVRHSRFFAPLQALRQIPGGADVPFFGMSALLGCQTVAYIPTTGVGTEAPPAIGKTQVATTGAA